MKCDENVDKWRPIISNYKCIRVIYTEYELCNAKCLLPNAEWFGLGLMAYQLL